MTEGAEVEKCAEACERSAGRADPLWYEVKIEGKWVKERDLLRQSAALLRTLPALRADNARLRSAVEAAECTIGRLADFVASDPDQNVGLLAEAELMRRQLSAALAPAEAQEAAAMTLDLERWWRGATQGFGEASGRGGADER